MIDLEPDAVDAANATSALSSQSISVTYEASLDACCGTFQLKMQTVGIGIDYDFDFTDFSTPSECQGRPDETTVLNVTNAKKMHPYRDHNVTLWLETIANGKTYSKEITSFINRTEQDVPYKITLKNNVTNLSNNSAVFTWTYSPDDCNGQNTIFIVNLSPIGKILNGAIDAQGSSDNFEECFEKKLENPVEVPVYGLIPNQGYSVHITAKNDVGPLANPISVSDILTLPIRKQIECN